MESCTVHTIQQPATSFGRFILNGLILSFIGILSCSAGLEPGGDFYDRRGNKIGTDGRKDGKKYIVTKGAEARTIRKITKMGGIAVYYYNGAKPSVIITKKAAERILKN